VGSDEGLYERTLLNSNLSLLTPQHPLHLANLVPDALAKVKQHLDIMVKACETTLGVSKNDCPYKGIDTSGMSQVKWTLVSLPELKIEQFGLDSVVIKGVGPGSVHLNALGADGKGIDRVDPFSINGKCVEDDNSVSCTFTA